MIRRDFFKAFFAASAALAVCRGAPAALPPPVAEKAKIAPPPDSSRHWEKTIAEMLEKCVVVGFSRNETRYGATEWEVEYLYDPDNEWAGATLNDELERVMPANAGMKDVVVTAQSSTASDSLLNDWGIRLTNDEPEYRINVTWVTA